MPSLGNSLLRVFAASLLILSLPLQGCAAPGPKRTQVKRQASTAEFESQTLRTFATLPATVEGVTAGAKIFRETERRSLRFQNGGVATPFYAQLSEMRKKQLTEAQGLLIATVTEATKNGDVIWSEWFDPTEPHHMVQTEVLSIQYGANLRRQMASTFDERVKNLEALQVYMEADRAKQRLREEAYQKYRQGLIAQNKCPTCEGDGKIIEHTVSKCALCNGAGFSYTGAGPRNCGGCGGSGRSMSDSLAITRQCKVCMGSGKYKN